MKVWIVFTDDVNENDCGCYSESIDSIWTTEEAANKIAAKRYHADVREYDVLTEKGE